jgi:hypothetical protein
MAGMVLAVDIGVDFVATHFRRYADEPNWPWWRMGRQIDGRLGILANNRLLASFNPLFRLSHRAACCLKQLFTGLLQIGFSRSVGIGF